MSSLHEKFDEIVADVPVYGDLDRAVEQAERERRQRYGMVAGLAAAAAVVAVIVGVLAVTGDGNRSQPPNGPVTTPTPLKSQSPQTWADTPVTATADGRGWEVPDPLKAARDAWFAIVAEHLDPTGDRLGSLDSSPLGVGFDWPGEGAQPSTHGQVGLIVDRGDLNLFDNGCRYLGTPAPSHGKVSCSTERIATPDGEQARVSRYQRMCATWNPGREGDDARPGPGVTYETCGEYAVAVAVERRDGLIGYIRVDGRGTTDYNPFAPAALAKVAADARLTLPEAAYAVPPDQAVASVLADHVPGYRPEDQVSPPQHRPGYASAAGRLGRLTVSVSVWPAGGTPTCGRSWLIDCIERRVFGADDPTTVLVSQTEELDWADVKESVATSREIVYVGPRHTVVAWVGMTVEPGEETLVADLDQALIDLVLDPRLQ